MTEISNWTFKEVSKYGMTVIELKNTVTGYRTHAIGFKDGGVGYEEANIKPITEEITQHVKQLFLNINGGASF